MSVSANYAPLNQCEFNTDSESEGEQMMELGNTLDVNCGLHSSKQPSMSDYGECNTTNANTIDSTLENISFLQSESHKLSVPRRIAFTASIFLCVFAVIFFLIGIPCTDTCGLNTPAGWPYDFFSYEMPYDDIELTGAVQAVDGTGRGKKNLIILYRGNHMKADAKKEFGNTNGIMQIVGKTGKVGWYISEQKIPTDIDCEQFLVNLNNDTACIVSGTQGLLAAVNPVQGGYYWYMGRKSDSLLKKVLELDFPLKIPDMDGDLICDLLVVTTMDPNKYHNTLIVISAKSGDLIGSPWTIKQCQVVTLVATLNSDDDTELISYNCTTDGKETTQTLTFPQLHSHMITNPTKSLSYDYTENVNMTIKKKLGPSHQIFQFGNGELSMLNDGDCHSGEVSTCQVFLNLTLTTPTKNVTWFYKATHAFALDPHPFTFARNVEGFIIKLWQWSKQTHVNKEHPHFDEVFFNTENKSPKSGNEFKSKKLNYSSLFSFVKETQFFVQELSEIILLIAYDHHEILHANVSQVDIIMLCEPVYDRNTIPVCQPDLTHQLRSLLIADLDTDNYHELISYHNTFLPPDENGGKNDSWRLASYVRVIRLENELPKLFPNYESRK